MRCFVASLLQKGAVAVRVRLVAFISLADPRRFCGAKKSPARKLEFQRNLLREISGKKATVEIPGRKLQLETIDRQNARVRNSQILGQVPHFSAHKSNFFLAKQKRGKKCSNRNLLKGLDLLSQNVPVPVFFPDRSTLGVFFPPTL